MTERKTSCIPKRAHLLSAILAAKTLRAIFNHKQFLFLRQCENRPHICNLPEKMDDYNRFRARRKDTGNRRGVKHVIRADIGINWIRPDIRHACRTGPERICRHNDIIAAADAKSLQSKVQRGSSRGNGKSLLYSKIRREGRLESLPTRTRPVIDAP